MVFLAQLAFLGARGGDALSLDALIRRRRGLPPQSLVLVDGVFAPELSGTLPAGVTVRSLASVLAEGSSSTVDALAAR